MSEHTQAQKKHAAVLIPLIETENGTEILFEVRADGISQANDICFPGGTIENGEDAEDAAVRETCEELLIDETHIETTYELFNVSGPSGRIVHVYAGILDEAVETYNENEIKETFLMPLEYFYNNQPNKLKVKYDLIDESKDAILNLINRDTYEFKTMSSELVFYETSHGVIWGLTGEIIRRYTNERDFFSEEY